MKPSQLLAIVDEYLALYPHEAGNLRRLQNQLIDGEKLNDRRNFHGHIAGSGIVLSPDRTQVLLINHKTFKKWMQPGGHWESDEEVNPLAAAQREVIEETGLTQFEYLPIDVAHPVVPIDLDTHAVPARPQKQEPDHWHHDFRYVFLAKDRGLKHQEAEVSDARWFAWGAPETEHVESIITKLRHFGFIE